MNSHQRRLAATQIAALTTAQLQVLNATQIQGLTPTAVANLGTGQMAALAPTQLAALSGAAITGLNQTQIAGLGEAQFAGLTATNLGSLGRGLQVFAQTLGPEWSNTVVVVLSEFGRTFRENGNRGTDHGHGTVYWVLGGAVRGGAVVGERQRLTYGTLFQDRDCAVLNDYRAVLGGLFRAMWGFSPAQSSRIFERAAPVDLKLV